MATFTVMHRSNILSLKGHFSFMDRVLIDTEEIQELNVWAIIPHEPSEHAAQLYVKQSLVTGVETSCITINNNSKNILVNQFRK